VLGYGEVVFMTTPVLVTMMLNGMKIKRFSTDPHEIRQSERELEQ
jgi:hypothetical protein